MWKQLIDKSNRVFLSFYDRGSTWAGALSDTFKLKALSSWLARRLSKPAALVLVELFVAISLTVNFFFLVKPECLPKPDGNMYSAFLFSYMSEYSNVPKDMIPVIWRTRLLAPMASSWVMDTVAGRPLNPASGEFQNIFGFYHAAWLFLLFLMLILFRRDALLVMLGVFCAMMYNYISPAGMYYYPWDGPSIFLFTLACLVYDRRWFGWLLVVVFAGGLFKETLLCCALLILLGEHWSLKKRIIGFLGTVFVTLTVNKLLAIHYGVHAQVLTMNNARSLTDLLTQSMLSENVVKLFSAHLNNVVFLNAGCLLVVLLLPWRTRRDIVFKMLILCFAAGQFYYAITTEFRDWYELFPVSWMLLSERITSWRQTAAESQALSGSPAPARAKAGAVNRKVPEDMGGQTDRIMKGSHWLMITGLLLILMVVYVAAELSPHKSAADAQKSPDGAGELTAKAQNGDAEAQYQLGIYYQRQQDSDSAIKWLQQAAESGHVGAENSLGVILIQDRQDYPGALKWFQKAADRGYPGAEVNLAILYLNGMGVKPDAAEAAALFRKGAEQGNVQAQFMLGELFKTGQGVKQDYVEAYKWLKLSELNGYPDAEREINACALQMTRDQVETAEKLARDSLQQKTLPK